MFGLGTTELLVIGGIIVLIFGAKRLPEIGKGLGGAIREFRKIKSEISSKDTEKGVNEEKKAEKSAIENKLVEKVIEDVPVVKKGIEAKKKADKIKEILK
jgi:sec-independent protein translocase protein TatA